MPRRTSGARHEPRFVLMLVLVPVLALGGAWWYAAADAPPRRAAPPASRSLQLSPAVGAAARSPATPSAAPVAELQLARALPPCEVEAASARQPLVRQPLEQGHGAEVWQRSDDAERVDFEPRYVLDAGSSELGATPPGAFH